MPTVEINGTLVDFPDSLTPDQLQQAAKKAASQLNGNSRQVPLSGLDELSSPIELLKMASPSNVLEKAGMASVNAPGMTNLLLNAVPGGNPSQILPSLKNIQKDPEQGKRALKSIIDVQGGRPMQKEEQTPAFIGRAAGTMLEMMAPGLGTKGIKGKNPFTAGVKDPNTALLGNFEKVGEELAVLKRAARVGENAGEAKKLRMMLRKPNGVITLAEEAKEALEAGKDIPVTRLLAYRQALGEAQSAGGTFADDFKQAADLGKELLKKKAPELSNKLSEMALNFNAVGKKTAFPWFTTALDPRVGLAKAATLPVIQNTAGALARPLVTRPGAIAALTKALTEDKAREYLRRAKGNPELARKMSQKDGYGTTE